MPLPMVVSRGRTVERQEQQGLKERGANGGYIVKKEDLCYEHRPTILSFLADPAFVQLQVGCGPAPDQIRVSTRTSSTPDLRGPRLCKTVPLSRTPKGGTRENQ